MTSREYAGFLHREAWELMDDMLRLRGVDHSQLRRTGLGKPYIEGSPMHLSLTHCEGFCACCLSLSPVGIDAEPAGCFSHQAAKKALTPREYELVLKNGEQVFAGLWTLKESYIKALGRGIGYGLKNAEFVIDEKGTVLYHPSGAVFRQQKIGGYIVSAAELTGKDAEICF